MTVALDDRAQMARDWALAQLGLDRADFAPASADASFRRYFRLQHSERSWVVMDAPPAQEDCRPFIAVTRLMQQAGVHVPAVLGEDLARGFLLLSDLGRETYRAVLDRDADAADALFTAAIEALVRWQSASLDAVLPAYDEALLRRELDLFPTWYVGRHLQRHLDAAETRLWEAVCDTLVDNALAQPRVLVHRDYMPRNLMISTPLPGVLDYQDAVIGPISYDAISLFKDAFLSWPQARVEAWLQQYWQRAREAGLPVPSAFEDFLTAAERMGSQRHLKVLGIFARIRYRDGKPQYLEDAPRFIAYLRARCAVDASMAPLAELFDRLGLA
jgi:N-acetylmuramate 1-kinase